MAPTVFPLPFETVRWHTRRFALSDFRFVALRRGRVINEIAVHDIADVEVAPSVLEHVTRVGTLVVRTTRGGERDLRVAGIPSARRQALKLKLLIADARGIPPGDEVARLPISSLWTTSRSLRVPLLMLGPSALLLTLVAIGIGLSGHSVPISYPDDDPIRPRGVRRSEEAIVEFMEREVMPWAVQALAPVVGKGRVTCETCHGTEASTGANTARSWAMPAVRALPEPSVRAMAEAAGDDATVRNALHGYLAEGDNQAVAAYMRGAIVPGMAQLLRRPAYDFAQTYEYNRSRAAFGCYHCHRVG
jgi:hypothetical protein